LSANPENDQLSLSIKLTTLFIDLLLMTAIALIAGGRANNDEAISLMLAGTGTAADDEAEVLSSANAPDNPPLFRFLTVFSFFSLVFSGESGLSINLMIWSNAPYIPLRACIELEYAAAIYDYTSSI
jgi:hypothetical protein